MRSKVKFTVGDTVRLVGGTITGVIRRRTMIDGVLCYLVQWNGESSPSFERRTDLVLIK